MEPRYEIIKQIANVTWTVFDAKSEKCTLRKNKLHVCGIWAPDGNQVFMASKLKADFHYYVGVTHGDF
jgi:hypothetical protein